MLIKPFTAPANPIPPIPSPSACCIALGGVDVCTCVAAGKPPITDDNCGPINPNLVKSENAASLAAVASAVNCACSKPLC